MGKIHIGCHSRPGFFFDKNTYLVWSFPTTVLSQSDTMIQDKIDDVKVILIGRGTGFSVTSLT